MWPQNKRCSLKLLPAKRRCLHRQPCVRESHLDSATSKSLCCTSVWLHNIFSPERAIVESASKYFLHYGQAESGVFACFHYAPVASGTVMLVVHGHIVWSDSCKQFWHWSWDQQGKVAHLVVGVWSCIPGESSLFVIRCHLEAEQKPLNGSCARTEKTNRCPQNASVEMRLRIHRAAFSDALHEVLTNSQVKNKRHSQFTHNDLWIGTQWDLELLLQKDGHQADC